MNRYYSIILAGGQGSRFWPQSRTLEPKQFLSLHKDKSLFEQTLLRIRPLIPTDNIFIVTCELYRHQIYELIKPFNIPRNNLIFEPEGKNTAPSIGVAARLINRRDPSARICILPCDHIIRNKQRFVAILKQAFKICENHLIIFGVSPHRPATGYGYIKAGAGSPYAGNSCRLPGVNTRIYKVNKFYEKPDVLTAKKFLKDRSYFWNSGIFVGSSRLFLREFKVCLPRLYKQLNLINQISDIAKIWKNIKPVSFDCGVLEKTRQLLMIATSGLGWSDLGSWQAWDEELKKDKDGNLIDADVVNLDSKDITILGGYRLIAAIGLRNLIIVDTPDALLVTEKNKTERVRQIVNILKSKKRNELRMHKTEKRPWGSFTILDSGSGFKVKSIDVKPGESLSLQFHNKRSEHWVVVEGKAKIVKGRKTHILNTNESIYFPVTCIHRLSNPSKKPLRIIEVQLGQYLEEDDIVRLKDDFGRVEKK